jgi:4-amino-4-deoxy-L-arabinose transferase-like glycosyltransferase
MILSALLLLALLGLVVGTFTDYGITYDEGVQNRYGRRLVRWYATLGANDSATTQNNLYLYGGFFELVVQGAQRLTGLGVYDNRHLVNGLFGLVGFVAVWGLGSHLGAAPAGFLSILFLALTPGYYGHLFANPKDLPFASLYALGAWLVLRASERVPGLGWRAVLSTGVAIGCAAGTRVAGLSLLPFAALLWLGCLWLRTREAGSPGACPGWGALGRLGLAWLGTVVLSWGIMLAFWPWALLDPIRNPLQALAKFSRFWNPDLLWEGQLIAAADVPRTYIVKALAFGLPEFYFLAFLLGAVSLLAFVAGIRREGATRGRLFQGLWLTALPAVPITWVVLNRTPLYNGYRHLLFVIPFLAVLAALGVVGFLTSRAPRLARGTAALALASFTSLAAVDAVQLHPYQYAYFNRLLAGGLAGAADRFDTDYWGASYKEATEWLAESYSQQGLERRVRVSAFAVHVPLDYYLGRSETGGRFRIVPMGQAPHLILAPTSYRFHESIKGEVVHVVERQGAPLLYVFEVRKPR